MKKNCKNILLMGLTTCFALLSIVLFNIVVDPYNIFFDDIKKRPGDIRNDSYFIKPIKIIQKKPDTLLLGTSTVDCGYAMRDSLSSFSEDTSRYSQYALRLNKLVSPDLQPLNAGVNGGSLFEIYSLLQLAYLNNPKLKHVIIGLEWHLFTDEVPPNQCTSGVTQALNKTHVPLKLYIQSTMTLRSTYDAFNTLILNHKLPKLVKNIRNIFLKFPVAIDHVDAAIATQITKKPPRDKLSPELIDLKSPNPYIYGQRNAETYALAFSIHYLSSLYSSLNQKGEVALLNPEAFDYLQRIVTFAKEKNIKLDIYISPQHGVHWVTTQKFGLGQYMDEWLRRIAEITPYWDFSAAIDFNDHVDKYFGTNLAGDDRHFNYAVGERILSTIMHGKPDPHCGMVYVTKENFYQMLMYRHQAQAKWLRHNQYLSDVYAHPKFVQMKRLDGEVEKAFVHYQPAYHGYDIFGFMDEFIAVPVEYAPYDLRRLMLGKYPHLIVGKTLGSLQKKIGLGMAPP